MCFAVHRRIPPLFAMFEKVGGDLLQVIVVHRRIPPLFAISRRRGRPAPGNTSLAAPRRIPPIFAMFEKAGRDLLQVVSAFRILCIARHATTAAKT